MSPGAGILPRRLRAKAAGGAVHYDRPGASRRNIRRLYFWFLIVVPPPQGRQMILPDTVPGMSRDALFRHFASSPEGLSSAEAQARQRRYGRNQIVFHRAKSPWRMISSVPRSS